MIGFTYAYFARTKTQEETNVYTVGNLKLDFVNDTNALILNNSYPITDEAGLNQTDKFEFDIKNNGSLKATYKIKLKEALEEISPNEVANRSLIKLVLFDNQGTQITAIQTIDNIIANNNYIYEGKLAAGETKSYALKMWLAEEAENDQIGKIYSSKLELEAVQE